jgi:hypothetical protein
MALDDCVSRREMLKWIGKGSLALAIGSDAIAADEPYETEITYFNVDFTQEQKKSVASLVGFINSLVPVKLESVRIAPNSVSEYWHSLSNPRHYITIQYKPEHPFALVLDELTHEGGEAVYNFLGDKKKEGFRRLYNYIKDERSSNYFPAKLFRIFPDGEARYSESNRVIKLFGDSNYVGRDVDGHPEDAPNELYASAFLVKHNYLNKFVELAKRAGLSQEQKDLISEIFGLVK